MTDIQKSSPQNTLAPFKSKFKDIECTEQQAEILYQEKLLSFDVSDKEDLERFETDEILFLKKIYFDSNLEKGLMKYMLDMLERPYSYSFDKIYWDFGSQNWKNLPEDPEKYINENLEEIILENFDEYIENFDESKSNKEDLINMQKQIDSKLKKV
jgi:hypothetical protein|tara:strand:+ start:121 stop:588 length:468 start_codon:yes stop_codon:yes gene_type:complete